MGAEANLTARGRAEREWPDPDLAGCHSCDPAREEQFGELAGQGGE